MPQIYITNNKQTNVRQVKESTYRISTVCREKTETWRRQKANETHSISEKLWSFGRRQVIHHYLFDYFP